MKIASLVIGAVFAISSANAWNQALFMYPSRHIAIVFPALDSHNILVQIDDFEAIPQELTLSLYRSVVFIEDPLVAYKEFNKTQIVVHSIGEKIFSLPFDYNKEHLTNGKYYFALTTGGMFGQKDIGVSGPFYVLKAGAQAEVPHDFRVINKVLQPRGLASYPCSKVPIHLKMTHGIQDDLYVRIINLNTLSVGEVRDIKYDVSDSDTTHKATIAIPEKLGRGPFLMEFVADRRMKRDPAIYRSNKFECTY